MQQKIETITMTTTKKQRTSDIAVENFGDKTLLDCHGFGLRETFGFYTCGVLCF